MAERSWVNDLFIDSDWLTMQILNFLVRSHCYKSTASWHTLENKNVALQPQRSPTWGASNRNPGLWLSHPSTRPWGQHWFPRSLTESQWTLGRAVRHRRPIVMTVTHANIEIIACRQDAAWADVEDGNITAKGVARIVFQLIRR